MYHFPPKFNRLLFLDFSNLKIYPNIFVFFHKSIVKVSVVVISLAPPILQWVKVKVRVQKLSSFSYPFHCCWRIWRWGIHQTVSLVGNEKWLGIHFIDIHVVYLKSDLGSFMWSSTTTLWPPCIPSTNGIFVGSAANYSTWNSEIWKLSFFKSLLSFFVL